MNKIQKLEKRLVKARLAVLEVEMAIDEARREEHFQRVRGEVNRVVNDMKAGYQPMQEDRALKNPPRAR